MCKPYKLRKRSIQLSHLKRLQCEDLEKPRSSQQVLSRRLTFEVSRVV
jgi:hypothetical protein